jgi:hypothetical protein
MAKGDRQIPRTRACTEADEDCDLIDAGNAAEKIPELAIKYFGDEIREALAEITAAIQAGNPSARRSAPERIKNDY